MIIIILIMVLTIVSTIASIIAITKYKNIQERIDEIIERLDYYEK